MAGIPDLLILHRGKLFCLELKAARSRVTDVQRVTHERLQRAGAIVLSHTA